MIERTVTVPAGPERVWEALTDPDEMTAWLGGRLDWTLEEGGPLRFVGDAGEDKEGQVEEVEPRRTLRFRWWDTGPGAHPDASEVQYVLEPVGDETLLTVREAAVPRPAPAAPAPAPAGAGVHASLCAGGPASLLVPAAWGPLDQLLLALEVAAHRPVPAAGGVG